MGEQTDDGDVLDAWWHLDDIDEPTIDDLKEVGAVVAKLPEDERRGHSQAVVEYATLNGWVDPSDGVAVRSLFQP